MGCVLQPLQETESYIPICFDYTKFKECEVPQLSCCGISMYVVFSRKKRPYLGFFLHEKPTGD